MPRQIIDTESSRPQYVRRVAIRSALIIIVVAALVYLAVWAYLGHRGAAPGKGNAPSARVSWQPSITPEACEPGSPKESPCFVA